MVEPGGNPAGLPASMPPSCRNTLILSCAPGVQGTGGVLALKLMRPLSGSKWAATSLRDLSEKRLGARPCALIPPVLVKVREPMNSALTVMRAL